MTIDIRIDFENNPSRIYYSGQSVRGTVQLILGEEKKIRGAYIRIYGKAYCRWSTDGKNKVTYIGEELFLNETSYLVGAKEGIISA